MAINQIWDEEDTNEGQFLTAALDYDTVNQTVGLTMSGQGHAFLTLEDNTTVPMTPILTIDCAQFNNDGQRHIIAGPGATGVDTTGKALPTKRVSAAQVALINPPHGQQPTMVIEMATTSSTNRP